MDREYPKKYLIGHLLGKGTFGQVFSASYNPDYFLKFHDLEEEEILTSPSTPTPSTVLTSTNTSCSSTPMVETSITSTTNIEEFTDINTVNNRVNSHLMDLQDESSTVDEIKYENKRHLDNESRKGEIDMKKKLAIKITKKEPKFVRCSYRELEFLKELNTHNINQAPIIKMLDCYTENDIPYLVFEYMDLNLYSFYKKNFISFPMAMGIFYQVALGLEYIHGRNIIHTDLKPENIMLDSQGTHLKIIDFGSAIRKNKLHKNFYIQSRYYRAPEVIYRIEITPAIDIWSLGCIIFEILFNKPLFPARDAKYELIYLFSISLGVPSILESGNDSYFLSEVFAQQYSWNKHQKRYQLKYKQRNDMPIDTYGLQRRLSRKFRMEYCGLKSRKIQDILLQILTYDYQKRLTASQILDNGFLGVDTY